jgi:D-tyrosyl-tRNA(Tyr) deacylase
MRAVIQRVSEAAVHIGGELHNSIGSGLLVLLGIEDADNQEDIGWLVHKISGLRIFADDNGVMNLSVVDVGGELLIISQFTLHANTKKGNRPSYIKAANPEIAIPLYEDFIEMISVSTSRQAKSGVFGADMKVALVNDGPVTIIIDTKNKGA